MKLEKVLTKSRQHPGMFFNKIMQWQAIKRSELLALTKKKACEAVKELVARQGRRPRMKNKKNAWRPGPLAGLKLPRAQTMVSFSLARAQTFFFFGLRKQIFRSLKKTMGVGSFTACNIWRYFRAHIEVLGRIGP